MRYEMRLLENGWAVWDTQTNAPAIVGGRWRTSMSMADADGAIKLLNDDWHKSQAHDQHPPPEEDLGGGDICSIQEQPSTDDDKPLD